MGFWKVYWKDRWRRIAAGAVGCGIFCLVICLYGLPLSAALYPTCLCAFLGIIALYADFASGRKRFNSLEKAASLSPGLVCQSLPKPETWLDAQYQAVIANLCAEAQAAEEEYLRRERDRTDYDVAWTHQIKTPIASMRLRLQEEDSTQSRALSAELLRIEQYVEMVLAYQRLDGPSTDFLFRPCRVDDVICQVLKRLAGSFILRGLRLQYEPCGITASTDEKWLAFVLEQLLSNALKYTPSGSVAISLSGPDTLCIRDTGLGIAPEDLPRVFERGFTGSNGRQDHRATGLGLYLSKRILDALNLGIRVESRPGCGTAVYLDFSQNRQRLE